MDEIEETALLLKKDFDLPAKQDYLGKEELIDMLSPVISQLLDKDFEKLLQICYRIDLKEQDFHQLMHGTQPNLLAKEISRALIERQLEKIKWRRKYKA